MAVSSLSLASIPPVASRSLCRRFFRFSLLCSSRAFSFDHDDTSRSSLRRWVSLCVNESSSSSISLRSRRIVSSDLPACRSTRAARFVASLAVARSRPRYGLPLLAYWILHSVESAPLNLELVFEHRMYAPMGALAVLLALAGHQRRKFSGRVEVFRLRRHSLGFG